MDLDWCFDDNFSNTKNFNENLIIDKEKKNKSIEKKIDQSKFINFEEISNCFKINLDVVHSKKDLLIILNYQSMISNYLRTFIRGKVNKFNDTNQITFDEYNLIIEYLNWLSTSCNKIKKIFPIYFRKDNNYDPNTIKLFKTSSYKFCNFKEYCSVHKNKNKCDKNHFVYDMIINDILKLIDSIQLIGVDSINWILSNKLIKVTYFNDENKYSIEKIGNLNLHGELNQNQFIVDKTSIFKSFDVVSYVLNKMYDEAFYFVNYDVSTHLINL